MPHQNYVITMYLKAIEAVHPYTQNTAAALRPGVSALAISSSKIRNALRARWTFFVYLCTSG